MPKLETAASAAVVGERCMRLEAGAEAPVDCMQAIMRT